ncbi:MULTISPECIES: DUF1622 domain-containing protein [Subtercola]|uniref:DUF1622 domain-containing protein n=1 Tax=Subtercola vilae TaxID=2056433 RepID=A0A4T2C7L8_9MICO|nr:MULTISPECIES: DUF1622 domain-containing protein [Subtercola]MEA9984300.1 DUF1622 domain-containing protein [Subtercola sp. RTI3]TIH40130.1 DUF1622 domain-containing protein [Subtercola vilae]
MDFQNVVEICGSLLDGAGVLIILGGAAISTALVIARIIQQKGPVYRAYRQYLGRSILLGLEFLVAADIIRTVAVTPTLDSVAVLAAIILIRTFLSFSLELEITGRWPWQTQKTPSAETDPTLGT